MGGLGNQMFQYALYRRIKSEGKPVKLDIFPLVYFMKGEHPYLMEKAFGLRGEYAGYKEARRCGALSKHRAVRLIERKLRFPTESMRLRAGNDFEFGQDVEDAIQSGKDCYLAGYWLNDKCFSPIAETIQREYIFKPALGPENAELLEKLREPNAVAVHLRKYSAHGATYASWEKPLQYYENAMKYMADRIENAVFYIFSNDIEWCRQNVRGQQAVFVGNNSQPDSGQWIDMQLMSHCRNCIISNSTYSWWAAYLDPEGEGKTVVAPKFWLAHNGDATPNLDSWIEMD
jgi:hypothetical protein